MMDPGTTRIELVSQMFIAYVGNNRVQPSEIQDVVTAINRAISLEMAANGAEEEREPAVPIEESVQPNFLVCLEDGRHFKSLKRHLSLHDLTPDDYRAKWSLPDKYPMVAPKYSRTRSRLAKKIGLGRKRSTK
jgi:MucR family transcriptional regulator, transcriptional regulator of exopolysaccharide biosynthesis